MLEISAFVCKGIPETNDDRVLVNGCLVTSGAFHTRTEGDQLLAALCDGVGGRACGYKAAETALLSLAQSAAEKLEPRELQKRIYTANAELMSLKSAVPKYEQMLTTLAGVYVDEKKFCVFHLGDSRVYRLRHQYLTQLTKDHSLVQDMVDLGEISREEAANHPQKNIITRCLGDPEHCVPTVRAYEDDLISGDIFLICSDGLSDVLPNERILRVLQRSRDDATLEAAAAGLVQSALNYGSGDNISVILIRKEG